MPGLLSEPQPGLGLGFLGFRVRDLGFRVWGLGFRVRVFRVWGLALRPAVSAHKHTNIAQASTSWLFRLKSGAQPRGCAASIRSM